MSVSPRLVSRVWSSTVRHRFAVGLALVSLIPLLTLILLLREPWRTKAEVGFPWCGLSVASLAVLMLCGAVILWQTHGFVRALHNELRAQLRREVPGKAEEITTPDEARAVDQCLRVILSDLHHRILALEKERERLQGQFLRAEKLHALRTMAMGVAHDFNNALAAILGNVSAVIRNLEPGSRIHENALEVESTALQAVDLTKRLTTYTGIASWEPREIQLGKVIEEVAPMLNVSVPTGTDIHYSVEADLPGVTGDPNHIRQMLINLVMNASEACPLRGGQIRVAAYRKECGIETFRHAYLEENFPPGLYVCLEVSDNGCGMTPEVQSRIFDPFFTTKIRAQGLGLSVVLGLVRLHHAAINVRSAPSAGTTIQIFFPATAGREPPPVAPGSASTA